MSHLASAYIKAYLIIREKPNMFEITYVKTNDISCSKYLFIEPCVFNAKVFYVDLNSYFECNVKLINH